ncbi:MAG: tRNA(Ile)-lysidine synthase [Lachnoclostridium sp.]|jgi:tRNA(Ile)-lysidine synthase
MLNKIKNFIDKYNMIQKGDRIVVGVSGGADSVCLFDVLLKLAPVYGHTLFVVHVNHGIRGKEADEDEAYVKKLCLDNQVSFTAMKTDVRAIAAKEGLSEEEAGRKVRYEAFYHCFTENKCNKIAIAHNKNDNAETILFHLFRGSGIKGLTGIQPVRDVIIRPLLNTGRDEIEAYLNENGISYRTDRTNLTSDYTRNKIRHQIISFAKEEINSAAVEHIVSAANKLAEIESYLEKNIEIGFRNSVTYLEEKKSYVIDINKLKQEDPVLQKGIIRRTLTQLATRAKDLETLHVELVLDLMEKQSGKVLNLPYGILAMKSYGTIILKTVKRDENQPGVKDSKFLTEQKLNIPGITYLPQTNQFLRTKLINYKKNMIIPRNGCTKWFDYDKIKNTILVRTRREGDYIQIDSAGNKKKIKSLFIDEKIPRELRELLPLVADGSHIMWVIGGRMSEAYKIDEETKVILEINLDGGN